MDVHNRQRYAKWFCFGTLALACYASSISGCTRHKDNLSGNHADAAAQSTLTTAFVPPRARPRSAQRTQVTTPPMQLTIWQPSRNLDKKLASATQSLFALGVADPRDLPYRVVTVTTGSVWGVVDQPVTTHGFLLPKTGTTQQCVLWDGLVHPCIEQNAGAPASLERDADALANPSASERNDLAQTLGHSDVSELWATAFTTRTWIKVFMLERLGKHDLAAAVRRRMTMPTEHNDVFTLAASEWLWSRFDCGLTYHMAGTDNLAYAVLDGLVQARDTADSTSDARGVVRPTDPGSGAKVSHFTFLEPVPALFADQARRARTGTAQFDVGNATFLSKRERIAVLIDLLDTVDVRQNGQPGFVALGSDSVVEALVREGDEAVLPLLDVLDHDDRLTRAVHFHRDFSRHRSILTVREAAHVALTTILDVPQFRPSSTGDDLSSRSAAEQSEIARNLRDHYARRKSTPRAEQ
jgi:hypothetical protein